MLADENENFEKKNTNYLRLPPCPDLFIDIKIQSPWSRWIYELNPSPRHYMLRYLK
jgi:hypothetical protein